MLPLAATEYDQTQSVVTTTATRAIEQLWRRMPRTGNWGRAWEDSVGPAVQRVLLSAQEAAAATASLYVTDVLAELDFDPEPRGELNIDAFVGVAGDGRPVDSLTYGAVIYAAKAQYSPDLLGLDPVQAAGRALEQGGEWLQMAVSTAIADIGRAAEVAATAQRPWVTGYVRMVSTGACSRCVILAGKFYRYNKGFLRHTRCHCHHIPSSESIAGDMTTNPSAYFESLPTTAELEAKFPDMTRAMRREAGILSREETFGVAGSEAVRLGADVNQVVNARRGMQTAQVYGRKTLITTEGVTARGVAGKSLGDLAKVAGQRYRVSQVPRIMPETILAQAKDPADALRLLRRFGYVL